ncbi:hypothetical protein QWZ13_04765 [Reinekea marina]|uniref:hypothetical protein n=1 Tax=Reinekea marina TaxID=1310421 RepID=UPI0025B48A18|nr:hypothetical protein [Reinekea marina]MDN3648218.1 hypothetical protein [Reinekea marina]
MLRKPFSGGRYDCIVRAPKLLSHKFISSQKMMAFSEYRPIFKNSSGCLFATKSDLPHNHRHQC